MNSLSPYNHDADYYIYSSTAVIKSMDDGSDNDHIICHTAYDMF